jgi:hypothetical protein
MRDVDRIRLCIEDPEANAGIGEITSYGELDGGEALVGECVGTPKDGEDVHATGETSDRIDLRRRERGPDVGGVRRHRRFEDKRTTAEPKRATEAPGRDHGRRIQPRVGYRKKGRKKKLGTQSEVSVSTLVP